MTKITREYSIAVRMESHNLRATLVISGIFAVCFIWGCEESALGRASKELITEPDSDTTIGSVADVLSVESMPVGGYGLVGNLKGTGSTSCPLPVGVYLTRYILRQVSGYEVDVVKLINSPDTAVVWVEGTIPALAYKNQQFDVKVTALEGTQTTSLKGGWLYSAELRIKERSAIATKTLAIAQGPVFIDTIDKDGTDNKVRHILNGGIVLDEYKINVILHKANFRYAGQIRNRLNERFVDSEVRAVSPSRIELCVPPGYKEQRQRFVSIVRAIYLDQTPETTYQRIVSLVRKLAVSDDKEASEIELEAIGDRSVGKLATLLNSSSEEVRFRAARCMLNLGSYKGLEALVESAIRKDSAYRVEAIEAITTGARRNDAIYLCRQLLRDPDYNIRMSAYEQLLKLDDTAVSRRYIAQNFYLDQVGQTEYKSIFVSRSGQPRIVLFGVPIYCRDGILVKSADGNIMISAPAGQKYVSLMRRHPTRATAIGPLKSSFSAGDIIQVLCEEPAVKGDQGLTGLGVSYEDMTALLKQMCDTGAIRAEFRAGPMPKFD